MDTKVQASSTASLRTRLTSSGRNRTIERVTRSWVFSHLVEGPKTVFNRPSLWSALNTVLFTYPAPCHSLLFLPPSFQPGPNYSKLMCSLRKQGLFLCGCWLAYVLMSCDLMGLMLINNSWAWMVLVLHCQPLLLVKHLSLFSGGVLVSSD